MRKTEKEQLDELNRLRLLMEKLKGNACAKDLDKITLFFTLGFIENGERFSGELPCSCAYCVQQRIDRVPTPIQAKC